MKADFSNKLQEVLMQAKGNDQIATDSVRKLINEYDQDVEDRQIATVLEDFSNGNFSSSTPVFRNGNLNSTGFKCLDNLIGGFSDGELVLVGGRPSMGTTQLLVNLALNLSKIASVFYFTFNQPKYRLSSRIISSLTKVPANRLERSETSSSGRPVLGALGHIEVLNNIYVNDHHVDLAEAVGILRKKIIDAHKIKFIVVDTLQELCWSGDMSKVINELKNIAADFGMVVFVASRLSHNVDSRNGDKRPKLRDLPQNKQLEEMSDKIIFVYRPQHYRIAVSEDGDSTDNLVELIVAKNKNGSVGRVQLRRDESLTNFVDL